MQIAEDADENPGPLELKLALNIVQTICQFGRKDPAWGWAYDGFQPMVEDWIKKNYTTEGKDLIKKLLSAVQKYGKQKGWLRE